MPIEEMTLYQNSRRHVIGVVKIRDYDQRPNAIAVMPGDKVYLTPVEERLTRNAPRNMEDNPLANGDLVLVDESQPEVATEVELSPAESESNVVPLDATKEGPVAPTKGEPHPNLPSGALPAEQQFPPTPLEADKAEAERQREAEQEAREGLDASDLEETAVEEHQQETGAAVQPKGQAEEGEFAQAEEVATPSAPSKPAPKSRSKKKA